MQNIKITDCLIEQNQLVPQSSKPQRYALATNLICSVNLVETKKKGMIVLRYEPEKWNQWYPFYSTVNELHNFISDKFGDMSDEFANILKSCAGTSSDRLLKADREFTEFFECGTIEICKDPLVPSEQWLKYSKTQNLWTYYILEFYCIRKVEHPERLLSQNKLEQALIPIDDIELDAFLRTPLINGIPVVENTVALMSDRRARQAIRQYIVSI
jgi:hypothetical protein